MTHKKLQIHSENILPIIKKWLYSDKEIFVRELVSNASDALQKVKILANQGQIREESEYTIEIQIDKAAKTLKFIDTGIGMDADEVEKYIAQIAFSGAEEFVEKYKGQTEKDSFIGHFGLGFYSAYMVASKVEINTLSYKEGAESVLWSCDGSSEYSIEKGTRTSRGTEITLYIDEESEEFLEDHRMRSILKKYCSFLSYPISLGTSRINTKEPLWIKNPSECTKQEYLEFYRHLYPMEDDPLFWVHFNVDYPFHLKGILYFPHIKKQFDLKKSTVQLYCNRVFVSDNCKDVIPEYLLALKGILDSPDIPLNVSRSYLQTDKSCRQLGGHISKKVADSLLQLYKTEKERYIAAWDDLSLIIKLGIIEDEKFYERIKDALIWKVASGEYLTLQEYLDKNSDKTKIFYVQSLRSHANLLNLYHKNGVNVLISSHPIDNYLMQVLERKLSPVIFQRIDSQLEESILDKTKESTLLNADGKTESTLLADFIRSKLKKDSLDIDAKSLKDDALPGFIMIDETSRRMQEIMQMMDPNQEKMPLGKKTFIVNTNSPLIKAIQKLDVKEPELASELVAQVYDLSLLSEHGGGDSNHLNQYIHETSRILEKLVERTLG